MKSISGFSKPISMAIIPGGAAGELPVPGDIKAGDTLLAVTQITDGAPPVGADITADCSIVADKFGTIAAATTDTTGKWLIVVWTKPR